MIEATKLGTVPFPVAHLRLPPFPDVALRVLRRVREDDVLLSDLADLIKTDPAFASEVMIVANSYMYSFRFPIRDIMQAVSIVGLRTLAGVCVTVGVRTYLGSNRSNPLAQSLWNHNLATALLAEQIASYGYLNAAAAYTSGILHDIGRLGIAMLFPGAYAKLLAEYKGSPASILAAEKKLFGLDHCEFGKQLVTAWKFPPELAEPVIQHHAPRQPDSVWDSVELLKTSCLLADVIGYPVFPGCETVDYCQIVDQMPEKERVRMPETAEELHETVADKISSLASI